VWLGTVLEARDVRFCLDRRTCATRSLNAELARLTELAIDRANESTGMGLRPLKRDPCLPTELYR